MVNCLNCGSQYPDDQVICTNCGRMLNETPPPTAYPPYGYAPMAPAGPTYYPVAEQKSKVTAGILGLILGGFGVGRFYLGYTGMAVAQLLVTIFTAGIGGLWGFIDGIVILTGGVPTDANNIPLKD